MQRFPALTHRDGGNGEKKSSSLSSSLFGGVGGGGVDMVSCETPYADMTNAGITTT